VLADYHQQLITTGTISVPGEPSRPTSVPRGDRTVPTSAAAGPAAPKVSARQVAAAEAEVLRTSQAVERAEAALADADLRAPIDGVVGAIGLAVGGPASGGTVTIVGEGTAAVVVEVPLATRTLLAQGVPAEITPAGALSPLAGRVSTISVLEAEGTAGDNPGYATTIVADDPEGRLADGALATVSIGVRSAHGAVTVPASALTPTGDDTATVHVVTEPAAEASRPVEVTFGAVGGGRAEITSGLEAGQLVVLSDRTAALPSFDFSSAGQRRPETPAPR